MHKSRHTDSVLKRDDGQTINICTLKPFGIHLSLFHIVGSSRAHSHACSLALSWQASQDNTEKSVWTYIIMKNGKILKENANYSMNINFGEVFFAVFFFCVCTALSFRAKQKETKQRRQQQEQQQTSVGIIKPLKKAQHCKLLSTR